MDSEKETFQIERHEGGVLLVIPPKHAENLQWDLVESAAELVLEPIKQEKVPIVVVDLSGIEFFGSVFLSLLLRCWKLVATRGGTMVLCEPSQAARELLRVTALDTLWAIYDSRQEAIEVLSSD